MEMVREAGLVGLVTLFVFVFGLGVTLVSDRARRAPVTSALPFAVGLLALGELGQGLGQRQVRAALEGVDDVAARVTLLNAGSGEAAANLVLGGQAALVLLLVAGAVSLAHRRP